MCWKDAVREYKIRHEELYHLSYIAFHESERLQRYAQNTKTENRMGRFKTDRVTFYRNGCRCVGKREGCSTPGAEHEAIWGLV